MVGIPIFSGGKKVTTSHNYVIIITVMNMK